MFNKYPYTDFHELNLDWILKEIQNLHETVENFVAYNQLKFSGTWDGTKTYEAWTVVDDGSGNGYLSLKPVPAGVILTNTEYWSPMSDYNALYTAFNSRITALETFQASVPSTYVPQTRTVNGHALNANATVPSSDVPYDNTVSGLSATNVKAAIDEIDGITDVLKGFTNQSWTEDGITYKVCRSGNICEIIAESGAIGTAYSANATIAHLPAGFLPRYINAQAWDVYREARITINTDGTIKTSVNIAVGDLVRFYATYVGQ